MGGYYVNRTITADRCIAFDIPDPDLLLNGSSYVASGRVCDQKLMSKL